MGTSVLGIIFNIIKPLWIWGTVASAITAVPASGLVLRNINKKDSDFKKYLKKRGSIKNTLHFIKSTAKIFIPIYNIIHPFHNLGKLFGSGTTGLKDEWKGKILKSDDLLSKVKDMGTNTKKLTVGIFNKIKNSRKKSIEKTETPKATSITKTNTQTVNPVITNPRTSTQAQALQVKPVVKSQVTKPVATRKKTSYELLTEKLDAINASDYETSAILKYYSEQYWAARKRYDALLETGMETTEEMDRILLFYNKRKEFEQIRGLTQKPVQPVIK